MKNPAFILTITTITFLTLTGCGGEAERPAPSTEKQTETIAKQESAVAGNAERGRSLFVTCTACHGPQAEGMKTLGAPALAGQEPYYIKKQLNNFRTGKRGVHEKDTFGAQMAPMSKTLDDQGVDDVIAYIKTLPSPHIQATLEEGDIEHGKNYYNMICDACHGPGAKGTESLLSPKLVGIQDWYLERQLNNFRQGIRGKEEGDITGAQMQQIASSIPDDQTVLDLVTYLNSLNAE